MDKEQNKTETIILVIILILAGLNAGGWFNYWIYGLATIWK